jgi:hypothetical protein
MDIVLQCSITSRVNALIRLAKYKVFVCSSNPFMICVHIYKEAYYAFMKSDVLKNLFQYSTPVGIAMGYKVNDQGSIPGRVRFFSTPQYPNQFRGPPTLLSNGYWGLLPHRQSSWGLKLTPHLHLMPRS